MKFLKLYETRYINFLLNNLTHILNPQYVHFLLNHGYLMLHFNFSVNSDILRRRKRDVVSTKANIETTLHLEAHGDKFVLNVKHSKPVIHPNAAILFTNNDVSKQWPGTNPDCFMTGKLTSHDAQTVVVSYCDNLVNVNFKQSLMRTSGY